MDQSPGDPVCPVCTLAVRREIPLEDHLNTHPKDQVIRALVKCSVPPSATNLPPPPPLTPAPTANFQYIQSSNNVVQYPYPSFIPIVYGPFGMSTQPAFLPQAIFNGGSLATAPRPAITATSGGATVNISGLSLSGSLSSASAPIPISIGSIPPPVSANAATAAASGAKVAGPPQGATPRAAAVKEEKKERPSATEMLEESRGLSEHESIVPDIQSEEEDEEEEQEEDEEPECRSDDELEELEVELHSVTEEGEEEGVGLILGLEQPPIRRLSRSQPAARSSAARAESSTPHDGPITVEVHEDEPVPKEEEEECSKSPSHFLERLSSPAPCSSRKKDHREDREEDEIATFSEHLSLEQFSPKDTVSMRDIQTDETMPAQGELSEESLGADTASLWGPAAEDVFSELASHGHPQSGHLLSDWPPLLGADIADPTNSGDAAASSSSASGSGVLVGDLFCLGGASEVKLEVKSEQWVKLERQEVKQETIELVPEPEKVLMGVLGEESLLVQQSDNRRQQACPFCHESFSTPRELKIHRLKVHRRTLYKCSICLAQFQDRGEFHAHNKAHPLECLQCGKTFGKRSGLTLHMKRHLGVKPYKCHLCDKSFITNQKLAEHVNGHTGQKPHSCKECGKAFKRHSNLIQHRNWVHKGIRKAPLDLMCDFCNKIFHTKRSMSWHLEIHLKTPRVCRYCPQRFIHNSSLTRHIRTMHDRKYVPLIPTRPANYVECPSCFGIFCKTSLVAHLRTHTGARPYACNICFKAFATKWNLQQHRWTHEGPTNRPLRCTLCRKSYFRREDLECHIRSHKNQRPYCCDFCGQKFARRYNCIRHMREHINEKQYSCSVCPKSFHRSYYLKEHMRVHTGVKPWSCHICGKCSTTKSNHNKHVKTHHARESVTPEG